MVYLLIYRQLNLGQLLKPCHLQNPGFLLLILERAELPFRDSARVEKSKGSVRHGFDHVGGRSMLCAVFLPSPSPFPIFRQHPRSSQDHSLQMRPSVNQGASAHPLKTSGSPSKRALFSSCTFQWHSSENVPFCLNFLGSKVGSR